MSTTTTHGPDTVVFTPARAVGSIQETSLHVHRGEVRLTAEGGSPLTPAEARQVAALLLDAADRADRPARGSR